MSTAVLDRVDATRPERERRTEEAAYKVTAKVVDAIQNLPETAEDASERAKRRAVRGLYGGKDRVKDVANTVSTTVWPRVRDYFSSRPYLRTALLASLLAFLLPPLLFAGWSLATLSALGLAASLAVGAAEIPLLLVGAVGMLIGLAAVGMVVGSVWGPVLGWLTVTRGLPLAWNRLMRALGLAEKELEAQTSAAVRGAKHGYVDAKEHRVHEFDSNGKPSQ